VSIITRLIRNHMLSRPVLYSPLNANEVGALGMMVTYVALPI
jgi:hypothetical protein